LFVNPVREGGLSEERGKNLMISRGAFLRYFSKILNEKVRDENGV